jgi:hypothetical protein
MTLSPFSRAFSAADGLGVAHHVEAPQPRISSKIAQNKIIYRLVKALQPRAAIANRMNYQYKEAIQQLSRLLACC